MDGSILFLAIPRISQAFRLSADQALWILDVYGFAVGSLLVTFGNIGDRYDRLKLLLIGAAVSGASSTAAGLLFLLPTAITGGIGWYIVSTVIAGGGYGICFSVVADTAVGAVPTERAGSAGALAETGNALGIALLGSLAALVFRLQGPDLAPALDETLRLPDLAPAVVVEAKTAFVSGLHLAAAAASVLHTALGVLTFAGFPDP